MSDGWNEKEWKEEGCPMTGDDQAEENSVYGCTGAYLNILTGTVPQLPVKKKCTGNSQTEFTGSGQEDAIIWGGGVK